MDGVERVMVLGIFAVIVAILSIAAWGVTADEPEVVTAMDGGAVTQEAGIPTSPPLESIRNAQGRETLGSDDEDELIRSLIDRQSPPVGSPEAVDGASPETGRGARAGGARAEGRRPGRPQGDPVALKSTLSEVAAAAPVSQQAEEPVPESPFEFYEVQPGDTLWRIARKQYGEGDTKRIVSQIESINPDIDASSLPIGRKIKLPNKLPDGLVTPPLVEQAAADGNVLYTVREGDSLQRIAQRQLGDSGRWNEIWTLNKARINDPASIQVGQTLLLPKN